LIDYVAIIQNYINKNIPIPDSELAGCRLIGFMGVLADYYFMGCHCYTFENPESEKVRQIIASPMVERNKKIDEIMASKTVNDGTLAHQIITKTSTMAFIHLNV